MTTQSTAPTKERTALVVLLADAQSLAPGAACMAAIYLDEISVPDVWRTVLIRALDARAGDIPKPPLFLSSRCSAPSALGALPHAKVRH